MDKYDPLLILLVRETKGNPSIFFIHFPNLLISLFSSLENDSMPSLHQWLYPTLSHKNAQDSLAHHFPWTLPPHSSCCCYFPFLHLRSSWSTFCLNFPSWPTSALLNRVSTTTSSLRILHEKCQNQLTDYLILSFQSSSHPNLSITSVIVDELLLKHFLSLVPIFSLLYLSGYLNICCIISWRLKPN